MPKLRTMMPTFDPQSVKEYGVMWHRWLTIGETITASTWSLPAGLVIDDGDGHGADFSATETWVWIKAGDGLEVGANYDLTNHIVTSAGREEDQTIVVPVRAR